MRSSTTTNDSAIDFDAWFTDDLQRNTTQKSLQALALSLVFITTIMGNLSVVLVLVKNFSIKNVPNMLLFCLSSINLAIGLINMPFAVISTIEGAWIFENVWCEISGFLNQFLTFTSNTMVTVVAMYRYQAIANTFSAQITYRGAKWIMAFAWFYSLVFSIPPLFGWNSYQYSEAKGYCTLSWQDGGASMAYTVLLVTACFLLPFVAIVFMYVRIGVITRYNSKTLRTMPTSSSLSSSKTQASCTNSEVTRYDVTRLDNVTNHGVIGDTGVERRDVTLPDRSRGTIISKGSKDSINESKTITSIFYVIMSYGLFLAPYYVMNIASALSQDALSPEVDFTVAWLHYCHATAVAVVYGYNNSRIRTFLKQLPWWPRRPGCLTSNDERYVTTPYVVDHRA